MNGNGFTYYRKCPTCGQMELIQAPVIPQQPYYPQRLAASSQLTPEEIAEMQGGGAIYKDNVPKHSSPSKIGMLNNGKDLEGGGVEAGWGSKGS